MSKDDQEIRKNARIFAQLMQADPSALFCLFWFGLQAIEPGIDLGYLGAPGCFRYTSADFGALLMPVTAGASSYPVAIPPLVALIGYRLTVQVSAPSPATPVGFVTSNAVTGTLGV